MREIFVRRGKRVDNGEWVYGNIVFTHSGRAFLLEGSFFSGESHEGDFKHGEIYGTEVISETVGQYTGLKDKNGVRVFEGDIINHYIKNSEIVKTYIVEWESRLSKFVGRYKGDEYFGKKYAYAELHEQLNYEVIGNVHDNPGLLKGEWL